MPSAALSMRNGRSDAITTMMEGLQQMFDIMVNTSETGKLDGDQATEFREVLDSMDHKGLPGAKPLDQGMLGIKAFSEIIRHYMIEQTMLTTATATPREQLKYIVKTFLMKLDTFPREFSKKCLGDSVSCGAVKYAYHPLNFVMNGCVHFVPYMIFELNGKRFVLSAQKSVTSSSPDKVSIEIWLFEQDEYSEGVQTLAKKGWDWTFTDNPSEPASLMQEKLGMIRGMGWKEIGHVNKKADARAACFDAAAKAVGQVLEGEDGTTIAVMDIRYEGIEMSVKDQADELKNFNYTPDFPSFELV
jgi:hypothetical protein